MLRLEKHTPFDNGPSLDVKDSMNQIMSSQSLCSVIDQTRCSHIKTPNGGVSGLHLHLVSVMGLIDHDDDPLLNNGINRVLNYGL